MIIQLYKKTSDNFIKKCSTSNAVSLTFRLSVVMGSCGLQLRYSSTDVQ